jgi:L-threonylcarbamoyladenylate synthase
LGGFGVAAPSANRFGAVSPTTAKAVDQEIGAFLSGEDILLDGGPCLIGIESTIIDCTGNLPTVLRPGAITKGMIESATETKLKVFDKSHLIRSSGLLESHYSPKAKVLLNHFAGTGEGFIALASVDTPPGAIRLGKIETTEQFAREIYKLLRLGDSNGLARISVILPHEGDLAEAIADRMSKAAAR